jgi:hypothetical protein
MTRRVTALALATTASLVTLAGVQATHADASPERGCVLPVELYEDNSWGGVAPRFDGQQLTDRWVVSGPELQDRGTWGDVDHGYPDSVSVLHVQLPATFHGQPCRIVLQ